MARAPRMPSTTFTNMMNSRFVLKDVAGSLVSHQQLFQLCHRQDIPYYSLQLKFSYIAPIFVGGTNSADGSVEGGGHQVGNSRASNAQYGLPSKSTTK